MLATLILIALVSASDSALSARQIGVATLGRWNRGAIYALAWIAVNGSFEAAQILASAHGQWAAYNIPAASMLPTLRVGDHLFAWKNYYGAHEPQRGDIAVFKLPRDGRTDYVKRVLGLPGDQIQIRSGSLYINDVLVQRQLERSDPLEGAVYTETLPSGIAYSILEAQGDGG